MHPPPPLPSLPRLSPGIFFLAVLLVSLVLATALAPPVSAQVPGGGSLLANEELTSRYFDAIRDNPAELRAFFSDMPKGGDLHTHINGAVYTETLIDLAAAQDLCVVPSDGMVSSPPCSGSGTVPVREAYRNATLYQNLIDFWSLRDYTPVTMSAYDRFFLVVFPKIGLITRNASPVLSADRSEAAVQNIQYMETILQVRDETGRANALASSLGYDSNLSRFRENLLAAGLGNIAQNATLALADLSRSSDEALRCGTAGADPGCNVTVRYLYQASRTLPKENVFAQLLLGFEVVNRSPLAVGVNIVGAEDDYTARTDYSLHMEMVGYLRSVYPAVNVTLHAGELAPGLVPPQDLRSHIRDAVVIAGAQRIGHAVDIASEERSSETIRLMASRHIAVEAPLVSNAELLGVEGGAHPFPLYIENGVPVVLATDDEGIERTDLTEQFVIAAGSYPEVTYRDLKQCVRNSLEYSFLRGGSLWAETGEYSRTVSPCSGDVPGSSDPSAGCSAYLGSNEKARMQWQLERNLADFEEQIASNPPVTTQAGMGRQSWLLPAMYYQGSSHPFSLV